jgi:uncharacterized glyoxalase superfamily protein PhnB
MRTLSPHLTCAGAADAIAFYKAAFDAVELMRLPTDDGRLLHACVSIGGHSVLLVDEMPEHRIFGPKALGGAAVTIHLMVEDVDAAFAQAVLAGAEVVMPVAEQFWGDRYGVLRDPFGHLWSLATPGERAVIGDELVQAMRDAPPLGEQTQ